MATIMIVEDNLIYRELLGELCEMEGHDVVGTAQAEEALALLANYQCLDVRRQRRTLDLIITDFNMDGMNGYEFLREVRRYDALRRIPILMISSTTKNMSEILSMEGVSFLAKPCPNATVMEHVHRLLAIAAPRRAEPLAAGSPGAAAPREFEGYATLPPYLNGYATRAQSAEASRQPPPAPRPEPRPAAPAARRFPPPPPPPVRPVTPPPTPAENRTNSFGLDDGIRNRIADSSQLSDFLSHLRRPAATEHAGFAAAGEPSSPVADLLEKILDAALRKEASDIHVEPSETMLEVRVRVDGALQSLVRLPMTVAENLIARIKIVSTLNITEKRLPQDGQFAWRSPSGKAAKFRVSTLPSVHGEKVVIRVLPSESVKVKLDSIGLSAEEHALVKRVLSSPNGLILVTGPTGSGKTTTLYTMLDSLNTPQRNIVTVEDPVEYQLAGITQVQVNASIGYTFERVLRSFLRQDPDVMLVGEIRDAETGEIALKAAVTGRIVLSTLHTNDAAAAVHRLIGMGLSAHLVAAATRLVIAQRLVRKLCPACRTPSAPTSEEILAFEGEGEKAPRQVWRPRGCPACHGVGYSGRRPVFEILPILSHETRLAVAKGAAPGEIRASCSGMPTLRKKALALVAEGATSPEEALSVLYCL
jgi:type IV pilus assembly protein PilB